MNIPENKRKNAMDFLQKTLDKAAKSNSFGKVQFTIQDGIPTRATVEWSVVIPETMQKK